jgi:peptide/nickel transport system permease protein
VFAYVVRRLFATIVVMAVVAFVVFLLLYLTPGDPAAILAGDAATSDDIRRIREKLGLDEPFLSRFGNWVWRLLHGDLGVSIFTNLPVTQLIGQRIEPTLSLTLCTLVVSVLVAVPLGVVRRGAGRRLDRPRGDGVLGGGILGAGLRDRLCADHAVLDRARVAAGAGVHADPRRVVGVGAPFDLPSAALSTVYIALIARITRASMLDVLAQDYVRTAEAKGLAPGAVLLRHALKNAAVPIATVIGIGVALLIGGAIVTETVFALPGIGRSRWMRSCGATIPSSRAS